MDNLDFHNPAVPNLDLPIPLGDDLDKPIRIDDLDKPIPLNNVAPNKSNVSHAPLNLGGPPVVPRAAASPPAVPRAAASPSAAPAAASPAAAPVARVQMPKGTVVKSSVQVASSDRITGAKTFFTKLHPGAIQFLDEQICAWLKANPGVVIKRTNVTTGEVQSKKTEPNILITVWY